jgi:hypothetical protein
VDDRIGGVDQSHVEGLHLLGGLHLHHHRVDEARQVRERVAFRDPLHMRVEARPVHRRAVGAHRGDRHGRRAPAALVGLLGHLLLLVLAERDDGGESAHRHRDADEAQQHPELVVAQLRPRLAERADEAGHEATSIASS